MSCAIPGCTNNKRKKKTLFSLPKDPKLSKAWITRINRKDELPKSVYVCEDHFESTDFDANNEIKIRYREEGKDNVML